LLNYSTTLNDQTGNVSSSCRLSTFSTGSRRRWMMINGGSYAIIAGRQG
jgi:hypothetical protein